MLTRRDMLSMTLASGAAAALARFAKADYRVAPMRERSAAKKILILGGTGFLGPACTDAALARGHAVTHFNRGARETMRKARGRPSMVPGGVETLYGNRDPNLTADDWKKDLVKDGPKDPDSPKGLSQLEGKKWDAVIDTSGYFPRMVKASAELLAPNVSQYVFISSISVYKDNDKPDQDESAELGILKDPAVETMGANFENYGPAKNACEQAAEKAMPGRVANIRPGFIVGPRDTTARFQYWPSRVSAGGEMAIPGTPHDPIQIIDVRDLAEWLIHLIETNTNGEFNATGPGEQPLTFERMLHGCKAGLKTDSTFTWIDPGFIKSQGLSPDMFPLWIPPEGESAGFHKRSIKRAIAAGLKFRPVEDTARATMDWFNTLPPAIQKDIVKLLDPDREADLLKAWHARKA
ncbi:MAG: NAD-dependent epimerase/dehydratase family protein [Phycisphaerales bacterium]